MDLAKELYSAVLDGVRHAVKDRLCSSYSSPLDRVFRDIVAEQENALRDLLRNAVTAAAGDPVFRAEVAAEVRARLARILVQRFGGELERQVNALKSDPATRARITLAVEQIVAERSATAS